MENQKYLEYVEMLVAQNPGEYSQTDLIKETRLYGIKTGFGDPGLKFSKELVEGMVSEGKLEMKTQEAASILQMNLDKKAFIGR